jgi:hypothetical protein
MLFGGFELTIQAFDRKKCLRPHSHCDQRRIFTGLSNALSPLVCILIFVWYFYTRKDTYIKYEY